MKNLRRHLGPGYTMYPAKWIGDYLGDKLFKFIMWIVCSLLWGGIYFIALSVVNFNRSNFFPNAKPVSALELGMTGWGIAVYAAGCIAALIMVIRSRRNDHQSGKKTVRREDRLRRSVRK